MQGKNITSERNVQGKNITCERNVQGTDTTSERNVQGTDITCERNVQGTDTDHTDGHYITLFAEQLTRTFEVLVICFPLTDCGGEVIC